ncbi:histone deacetylase family protein [Roseitalea porphyridii]|uniref:Histone deacetylase n=1 Tax=Roseitalea porphyridii TaxID=1852022 RepID=A0A4P6UY76_9HYPH|nr:histone deacetylase [Roseitalea porphyridii]QBK29433.1 histone deacetylase [Roseitalea porphyridii]
MTLPIVHNPAYDALFDPDHRFPMGKYRRLAEVLVEDGLAAPGTFIVPAPAPRDWVKLAHDATYVDQVYACAVPRPIEREIGFEVTERTSLRAQCATTGTVLAARLALEHGIACNTAGGSHHARFAQGAGFCTFNDVAVAARVLLADGEISNALVVDLDVHQGDGTADILAGDGRVFAASVHADKNYPVRKKASDFDLGLPDGMDDTAYLKTLALVLEELRGRMPSPDIVFYNAGVDVHAPDRLGRLALTDRGIEQRDRMVISHFRARGVPVCGVIGGGYSRDLDALARRHALLHHTASEFAFSVRSGSSEAAPG